MENIATLLHLLHDSPERLVELSRLAHPFPPAEAGAIWAGWAPNLAHKGVNSRAAKTRKTHSCAY